VSLTVEQFWNRLDRSGPDFTGLGPCWEWRTKAGAPGKRYGWTKVDARTDAPHRLAYQIAKGPIPAGQYVLHSCDNPKCCNPAHLEVGSQLENRRQAAERGRTHRKLTEVDALDVLLAAARGESQRSIAIRLGVARNSVVCVLRGETFRHVSGAVSKWLPPFVEENDTQPMTGTEG